ncbi:conserved Plasmodium protein, unknown function [Babesia microti strain RI]|uniref:Uncharacterized protein n=1 Tax=Babesia microti (strain RI) TaxID=1133968 RepID=A0A1R4ABX4_BABMR|nr:conserved Plasmodium protein, unknown function [Babesia microti strain RI]SJK86498.1 conserved Plasmodium protein, unknown function [Babesia microti strain RI]|eukprot:XP_021338652.1 conserved Plasmodium protein, unknown function [Babesia microti strain RI]
MYIPRVYTNVHLKNFIIVSKRSEVVDNTQKSLVRWAHSFAAPPSPNLDRLKHEIIEKFHPICFQIKRDCTFGTHLHDSHFMGILCSPSFEGKTYKEINSMVDKVLESIGLKGRVRLHCQPPSKFNKMYRHTRWKWNLDK